MPDKSPVLSAAVVAKPGKTPKAEAWCPFCEGTHVHDKHAAGVQEAACNSDSASPFLETGYTLDFSGGPDGGVAAAAETSKALYGARKGRRTLRLSIARMQRLISRRVKEALLGPGITRYVGDSDAFHAGLPCGAVRVGDLSPEWSIKLGARQLSSGHGLLSLASAIFGVPEGVAALRILEAAAQERLDAEAALELVRVIDAWRARGGKSRETRP